MSLASSPDCLGRPEDQAMKALFPTIEQPATNSFDDFFEQELYNKCSVGDNDEDINNGIDDGLIASNSYIFKNECKPGYTTVGRFERSPAQPWRKGLWCLNQKSSSQLTVEKTRKAQNVPPQHISPAHLVANDNYARRSPRSSNSLRETKNFVSDRSRNLDCHSPAVQQRLDREMSLSPSPMYSRLSYNERDSFVDTWQQDFQHINLDANDDCINVFASNGNHLASQLGFRQPRYELDGCGSQGMEAIRAATMYNMSTTMSQSSNGQNSLPKCFSTVNSNLDAASRNMFSGTPDRNDQSFQFINQDIPAMSDWTTTESLHSSNSSHNSQSSQTSIENHQNGLYNTITPQEWWSPPSANYQAQAVLKSLGGHQELHQPKPRRATHAVLAATQFDENGLGIKHPSSEEIGIAIPYHPPQLQPPLTSAHGHNHNKPCLQNELAHCPTLPAPTYHFTESSPFTTPRRRRHMRTPSPSISPTRISSRQRSPSRRDPSLSHNRRKSLHKSGPIKPSSCGPETPRHRSTSRSRSRPPRTPKTPRTPGACENGSQTQVGFVNFTPRDATKLLNDVAPSGSSKTRARREQEARDKRKKLSEAALEAVRRAGGDVEALERAILT